MQQEEVLLPSQKFPKLLLISLVFFFCIPLSSFLGLLLLCFKVFVELACIIMAVSSLHCWYCDINSVLLVDV